MRIGGFGRRRVLGSLFVRSGGGRDLGAGELRRRCSNWLAFFQIQVAVEERDIRVADEGSRPCKRRILDAKCARC